MNRRQRRAAAKGGGAARPAATSQPDTRPLEASAIRHYQAGRLPQASDLCRQILMRDPRNIVALHLSALMALRAGFATAAVDTLAIAIRLNDKIPDLHGAMGEALQRAGRLEEAIDSYRRAMALAPDDAETLYNCGNILLRLKRCEEALACYDRALVIAPSFVEAIHNRGNTLFELARYEDALVDYERALTLRPQFTQALSNRGNALLQLKRYDEALASCDQALRIASTDIGAFANRAGVHYELRRFAEAAADLERVLALDPDYPYARGKLLFCRMLLCDWHDLDELGAAVAVGVAAGKRVALPYMFLHMVDSPDAQRNCARIFAADGGGAPARARRLQTRPHHGKIRVAYLSADFRQHPMAYLMAGVFEAHDRTGFETTAISFGPNPGDAFRKRLENSFDRFLDVQGQSDRDLALLLRRLEVDIAVDLMGYTNRSRPGILAPHPAPIQVNFLGYAGTMAADYIDYLIADRFIVPDTARPFYTEKIVYLPDTYWPTDSTHPIGAALPTRAAVGLPAEGFVFCCFNNNYKILAKIFEIWTRLLRKVEGSVLWLVEDSAIAAENLRREAERRDISGHRLVFSPRVGLDDYLARLRLADLFLDTLPYNAHTTASDALWVGLPVLTCAGSSFSGRVAGSLLTAVGLPELITDNLEDYEALALRLASDRGGLAQIRSKLNDNRQSASLFATERFCRHLEAAYQAIWERHQRGEASADITIAPIG